MLKKIEFTKINVIERSQCIVNAFKGETFPDITTQAQFEVHKHFLRTRVPASLQEHERIHADFYSKIEMEKVARINSYSKLQLLAMLKLETDQ